MCDKIKAASFYGRCLNNEGYSLDDVMDAYHYYQSGEWKESCDSCHWYLTNKCPYEKGESFVMIIRETAVCPMLQKAIELIAKSMGRTHKKVQLYIEDEGNSLYCDLECDDARGDDE